jgi:hypothetical protein
MKRYQFIFLSLFSSCVNTAISKSELLNFTGNKHTEVDSLFVDSICVPKTKGKYLFKKHKKFFKCKFGAQTIYPIEPGVTGKFAVIYEPMDSIPSDTINGTLSYVGKSLIEVDHFVNGNIQRASTFHPNGRLNEVVYYDSLYKNIEFTAKVIKFSARGKIISEGFWRPGKFGWTFYLANEN